MLAVLALLGAVAGPVATAAPVLAERSVSAMGTRLELSVVAGSREVALAASEAAIVEVGRVENLLTTWRDSPLSRLNEAEVGRAVAFDPELSRLLEGVFAWSPRTGGAFDTTVLPLVRAWDLRGTGRVPSPDGLARALAATGTAHFRLDPVQFTMTRLDAQSGIEEGAWGKGYALDRAAGSLARAGASGALIDFGGQVIGVGQDARGHDWTVSVADPRRRDRAVARLRIADASASTSGNSERSRVVSGRRVGHLLDPRTGEPAEDFGSVTVVAPSALEADILSTAFFVLGPEPGLALSARLRAEGVAHETLFLVVRGDRLDARFSPGLPRLVISADAVVDGLPTTTTRP